MIDPPLPKHRNDRNYIVLLFAVPLAAMLWYGLNNHHRKPVKATTSYSGFNLANAIRAGKLDVIQLFLNHGEKLTDANSQPIAAAVEQKPPRVLRWLLNRGLDEKVKLEALIAAANNRNLDAIQMLVDAGANPNAEGRYGSTPLIAAMYAFVPRGADPNLEIKTVQALLKRGAKPNFVNSKGVTPLSTALSYGYRRASEAHRQTVHLLIQRGAPVGFPEACVLGDLKKVKSMLDAGADPNSRFPVNYSDSGQACLAAAAREGNIEVVRLLLKAGADPHAANQSGTLPILDAIYGGNADCVKILLDAGVSPNSWGDKEIMTLGAPNESGVRAGAMGRNRERIIVSAIRNKNYEIAKLLISRGADVNPRNSDGQPYILHAALDGSIDQVELMIRLGADVNVSDKNGSTALHMAVMRQNAPLVRVLMQAGANPGLRNNRGQSAADLTHRETILAMLNEKR